MSGFFEDDFDGDVLSVKGSERRPGAIEAPCAKKMVNSVLKTKPDRKQMKESQKGFTPNNRYKQTESTPDSNKKQREKENEIMMSLSCVSMNLGTN